MPPRYIGFLLSLALTFATAAHAAPAGAGPIGFASLGGGTSGGDPANVCSVAGATETALRNAIDCTQKSPRGGVVGFRGIKGTIDLDKRIALPSNITIQGPASLRTDTAGIFQIAGSRNVIVRDITFLTTPRGQSKRGRTCPDPLSPRAVAVGDNEQPGTTGCTVPITIQGTRNRKGRTATVTDTENVWIDHNTFIRCGDKCITIKNGDRKANGQFSGADALSISNNKFADSFFAILMTVVDRKEGGARSEIAHSSDKCEAHASQLPRMRASIYNNWFYHVRRRSARSAHCTSYIHEFNNVIEGFGLRVADLPRGTGCRDKGVYGFGPSAHSGGRLYLENNYIAAWPDDPRGCKAAVSSGAEDHEGNDGYVRDVGNFYAQGAFGGSNRPERVPAPAYPYSPLPAKTLYDTVTRNAGARS